MSEFAEIREDLIEQLRHDDDWRGRRRAALLLPKVVVTPIFFVGDWLVHSAFGPEAD